MGHLWRILCVFLFLLVISIQGMEINLVNGSSELEGRIEVFCRERWQAVCSRNLDNTVANQICRGLGFLDINAQIVESDMFGSKTPSLPTTDLNCEMEDTEPCQHSGGLICSKAQCQEWDVFIDNSSSRAMAQVCRDQTWKYVQHCSLNNFTASAFCKQSGYSNYGSYSEGVTLGSHEQISTFKCLGNESHLSQCSEVPCEGTNMASHIFCQKPCHRCKKMVNHITARISGSSAHLSWSFNSEAITSFEYYIANCSSTVKEGTTPVASIIRILTSSLKTSVRMTGIQRGYNYICCVTAKQKRQFDNMVCSEAVRDMTFELPGDIGTVFFYIFLIIFFLVVLAGVIMGLIFFGMKRSHKFSTKSKKVMAADFNKVLSQSILSLNDKGKRKDNLELSTAKIAAKSTANFQSTKPSEELVKSLTHNADLENSRQEYSVLSRVEKSEEKSYKVNPCVAYGAVTENNPGNSKNVQSPDYRDMDKSTAVKNKEPVTQYYEDI